VPGASRKATPVNVGSSSKYHQKDQQFRLSHGKSLCAMPLPVPIAVVIRANHYRYTTRFDLVRSPAAVARRSSATDQCLAIFGWKRTQTRRPDEKVRALVRLAACPSDWVRGFQHGQWGTDLISLVTRPPLDSHEERSLSSFCAACSASFWVGAYPQDTNSPGICSQQIIQW
jgi:hypothetical protein